MTKLNNLEELEQFIQEHNEMILFKHSNKCPISKAAYDEFMNYVKGEDVKPWALVIVQEARRVSNEIECLYGVKHETPQALYVKDGEVVWHASHWDITEEQLRKAVK
jgi:bacillithiol system protein YtxJ